MSYLVGTSNPNPSVYAQINPTAQSNTDLHSWVKGSLTVFSQTFAAPTMPGSYNIGLYIPDPDCVNNALCSDTVKKTYEVRLATLRGGQNVFDAGNGTNNLAISLTVNAGSGGGACAGGANQMQNCNFSNGTTSWHCGVGGTAAATCSVVNGEYSTVITNAGTAAYQVQPNQQNLSLANGTAYTVSFDARASVPRPISVSATMNHDSFSSYSGVQTLNVGTTNGPLQLRIHHVAAFRYQRKARVRSRCQWQQHCRLGQRGALAIDHHHRMSP